MEPQPDPLTYRPSTDPALEPAPPAARSLRTWLVLCVVWLIGTGVWALYLALIVWVVFRLFGTTAPSSGSSSSP